MNVPNATDCALPTYDCYGIQTASPYSVTKKQQGAWERGPCQLASVLILLHQVRLQDSGRATGLPVPWFPRRPRCPPRAQVRGRRRAGSFPPAAITFIPFYPLFAAGAPGPGLGRSSLSVEPPEHVGALALGRHLLNKAPRRAFLGSRSPLPCASPCPPSPPHPYSLTSPVSRTLLP